MKTKGNTSILIGFIFLVIAGLAYAQSDIRTFSVYGDSRKNHDRKIAEIIVKAGPKPCSTREIWSIFA